MIFRAAPRHKPIAALHGRDVPGRPPTCVPDGGAPSLPRIIYTLGRLQLGGAEMRSLQLFEAVIRQHPALEILVYVTSGEEDALDTRFREAGTEIVYGRPGLSGLPHFWKTCRDRRATLLHANFGTTSGFFALAAFLAGVRERICHFRATDEGRRGPWGRFKGAVGLTLIRLFATRVAGVCASARLYARVPERKWRTIYNGIECDTAEAAIRARPPRRCDGISKVIVLARISPEKDYVRPVAIIERIAQRREGCGVRLCFIGSGGAADLARLAARVAASPAAEAIVLHPPSQEPLRHLREADVLLLTSLWEGLPGSVLEALSVGTPVVASDLPGVREIAAAVDGVTLVPLAADDDEWADAILAALGSDRPEAIIRSFRQGPFRFEPYVQAMTSLWRLPSPSAAPAG
jgi:glycosyltransferase involved in cell wall biosynthesis